ncbi:Gfo/Idh/MocA family oxidoreductase [Cloacibacillus evryensis]|uniref:Gfo/Idh/MocA family oxidoreductase n=1 Tax=Cloacibacillus evryensis TaxID=508460 RepID=UPI0026E006B5|nr:Gfo/Idh/MocA family oxidoreductase [Cloacibacillus evryensis]
MKTLKLAFVGMGSIGKRHLNNVRSYLDSQGTPYLIDLFRSGQGTILAPKIEQVVHKIYYLSEYQTAPDTYDAVFITNPTSMHYDTIKYFANSARAMFIEKPVLDRTDLKIDNLKISENTICYVACPLRYHPVIDYVYKNISCHKAYAVRAICSSYLPDWRPVIDYRKCYSARRDMGGGVGIDLIHEWDYLSYLFGAVKYGTCIQNKISDLELDSDDIAVYIARTSHTVIELHLDYFGRSPLRQFQIFMPDETIECDILNGKIFFLKAKHILSFDCDRDTYQRNEIMHFFDILNEKCPNDNDISCALRTLSYAKGEF